MQCCLPDWTSCLIFAGGVWKIDKQHLDQLDLSSVTQDSELNNVYHAKSVGCFKDAPASITNQLSHVYAYQGKSAKPQLWDLETLLTSNAQLTEVDPSILAQDPREFCLPANGLECSLANRIVIVNKRVL